ncbi:unnamed protein product, partial [Polarella glacialis]
MMQHMLVVFCVLTAVHRASADSVALYKIVGDECGQATLDKKFEPYAVKFAGLSEGLCKDQGYTVDAGSKDVKVPALGDIKVELFKKQSGLLGVFATSMASLSKVMQQAPLDVVSLYKIMGDECGQATLDKTFEPYAVKFAGLAEGLCKDQGYTVDAGSKDVKVPALGDIKVELFKKQSGLLGVFATSMASLSKVMQQAPLDVVSLYKIMGDECGQATLDKKFEPYAVKFAGLAEGLCKDRGYTMDAVSIDVKVPALGGLGDIKVELFKKQSGLLGVFATSMASLSKVMQQAPLDVVSLYKIMGDECGQ